MEVVGQVQRGESKERPNGGQPSVARAYGVVPGGFEVLQEIDDERDGEISDPEVRGRPTAPLLGEAEEQSEGVTIRRHGVSAGASRAPQAGAEERREQGGEGGPGCAPRHGSPRWAASSRSAGVAVRYQYVLDGPTCPR